MVEQDQQELQNNSCKVSLWAKFYYKKEISKNHLKQKEIIRLHFNDF